MLKKIIIMTSLIALCCGCTNHIISGMGKTSYPLSYLHDSKIIDNKAKVNLCFESIKNETKNFPEATKVDHKKTFVLPLIFVNIWDVKYECVLGKLSLSEDLMNFVSTGLVNEAKRSGNFTLIQGSDHCDYFLELIIKDHNTMGPYRQYGSIIFLVLAFGANSSESAGPALSKVSMHMRLSRKGSVVLAKDIEAAVVGRTIKSRYDKITDLQADYANSMVESLSFAFKDCIEKVIQEVNSKISQDNNLLMVQQ